jgi:hypothetical protein
MPVNQLVVGSIPTAGAKNPLRDQRITSKPPQGGFSRSGRDHHRVITVTEITCPER